MNKQLPARRAFTIAELCAMWGLSRSTILRLKASGRLTEMRVGRRVLITSDSVEAWAAAARQDGPQ